MIHYSTSGAKFQLMILIEYRIIYPFFAGNPFVLPFLCRSLTIMNLYENKYERKRLCYLQSFCSLQPMY